MQHPMRGQHKRLARERLHIDPRVRLQPVMRFQRLRRQRPQVRAKWRIEKRHVIACVGFGEEARQRANT